MATTDLSTLPLAATLTGAEKVPGLQSAAAVAITVANIGQYVVTSLTVTISTGTASAGKVPVLGSSGRLDSSIITGSLGYGNLPQLVLGQGNFAPPADGGGSISPTSPLQISVSYGDATGGYSAQTVMFGNTSKPAVETYVRTRGSTPSDFSVPVLSGDRVIAQAFQGSTGTGQTGHLAYYLVGIDGPQISGVVGELPGYFSWSTGTGQATSTSPGYYGVQTALLLNSKQQAFFPGRVTARQVIAGTNTLPAFGADLGATLFIGAGGPNAGEAPLKFDYAHSSLLTVPSAGTEEVDVNGVRYTTRADGIRRRYVTADPAAPTITVGAGAGTGGSASIAWSPDGGGRITIVTGTSPDDTQPYATVTMANAYPNAIYPVLSPAGNRVPGIAGGYYTLDNGSNHGSFLIYLVGAGSNRTFVFNFSVTGA